MGVMITPLMDGSQSHLANVGRIVWVVGTADQNALTGTASAYDSIYNDESGFSEKLTPSRRMLSAPLLRMVVRTMASTWFGDNKPRTTCSKILFPATRTLLPHAQNGNRWHVQFPTQNAPTICVVMFKKRAKSDAMILQSWCSSMVGAIAFKEGHAEPLRWRRILLPPNLRRIAAGIAAGDSPSSPVDRRRNFRQSSAGISGTTAGPLPGNCRDPADQFPTMCPALRRRICRATSRQLSVLCPPLTRI